MLRTWTLATPILAVLPLAAVWGRELAPPVAVVVAGAVLAGAVLAAVFNAEGTGAALATVATLAALVVPGRATRLQGPFTSCCLPRSCSSRSPRPPRAANASA